MGFLIRTAFWLSLIILVLPSNQQEQSQVLGTATTAVRDVAGFCSRNPDTCQRGQAAFHTFKSKAEFGARMVMDFVSEFTHGSNAQAQMAVDPGAGFVPSADTTDEHGTLRQDDLGPAWRAPGAGA